MLTGNSANNSGGGAYSSTLNNCKLVDNQAYEDGGGAYDSMLNSCMISSNSVFVCGGGADYRYTERLHTHWQLG